MSVWDISRPEAPRQIGFMPVEGVGLHRIWCVGGPWAYASALIDGFTDCVMITIDVTDLKERATGRIDGMICLSMALAAAPTAWTQTVDIQALIGQHM